MEEKIYNIKASSYIINLLGDELIGSDILALFEIVKNAYDADSKSVKIQLNDLKFSSRSIIIEDEGVGMTPDIIENAWLTIGTDYKRKEVKVSNMLKRTSLGNKGVGRLAVHRLANKIKLLTQPIGSNVGSMLEIDWDRLIKSGEYINELSVRVNHDVPNLLNSGHGTKIILSELRQKRWNKPMITDLIMKLQTIVNPFVKSSDFEIKISSNDPQVQLWIDEVRSPEEILNNSLYYFSFSLKPSSEDSNAVAAFSYTYGFRPINIPASYEISPYLTSKESDLRINDKLFSDFDEGFKNQTLLKNKDLDGIFEITGGFYTYNLDNKILVQAFGYGNIERIKNYIADNSGVKIYRDNIRVYNYGESGDDWLGLDLAKTKRSGDHFSKSQTIGFVCLELNRTKNSLIEKTNREGFIENNVYRRFVAIVQSVFSCFEKTAQDDREVIAGFLEKNRIVKKRDFNDSMDQLEEQLYEQNVDKKILGIVKKVRKDYNNMKEVMIHSGMNGLNLTVVFHEVEREIRHINIEIMKNECSIDVLKLRIKTLVDLLEKFMPMMRQTQKIKIRSSILINRTLEIHKPRFSYHGVVLDCPSIQEGNDFIIQGVGGLLLSAISNIIDNSLYWTREQRDRMGNSFIPSVYVGVDHSNFSGPAIVVADNGQGFTMSPEDMIRPFRSLKADGKGMGIGLYLVSLVMQMCKGQLLFFEPKELGLPLKYTGACVALVFPK